MSWLIPRNELTAEQIRAIELSTSEHKVIFGAPGSGKTQILLHRARYLIDKYNISPDRFHIFVYTNVLKSYIRSALDLLNLPESCVSTLDAWCLNFYRTKISNKVPWDTEANCPDFVSIRKAVFDKICNSKTSMSLYDFILVDEGQDLDSISFKMLSIISKHITVCIDHKQRIYEKGLDEHEILKTLGINKRNITLLDAFRCCPYIVKLGSYFIENEDERNAYIRQSRTEQGERETPLLYYAANFDDEKQKLIELLRIRLAKNEKIGILVPQNRQVFGFAKGLLSAGFNVEWSSKPGEGSYNFNSHQPKILTFHGAKGLTFDTIIIPRLVNKSFQRFNEQEITRLLFVGITRAEKWVALLSNKKNGLPQLYKLNTLAQQGFLTIQENQRTVKLQEEQREIDDNKLLDLL
ncbi:MULTISPECIES: UvrD-helicase domain-containing protein [Thermodesulfovibrio]|uniref:UvrD-helicase domain-containing protein n=1 Tax=Thermodesulfovibrio TaxID=28261 RepID=UPI0026117726|nr:UvrD-helicase domain-containing protein [Thermodesulfovibrio sp.]